jgi:hypothetical protein
MTTTAPTETKWKPHPLWLYAQEDAPTLGSRNFRMQTYGLGNTEVGYHWYGTEEELLRAIEIRKRDGYEWSNEKQYYARRNFYFSE